MKELTLALIKPDAWENKLGGAIISKIENYGFTIRASYFFRFTKAEAEEFYGSHKGSSYFDAWIEFMRSGPTMALVLEKENAIVDWRTLMGATDPDKADDGTIRKLWGKAINRNLVHGSDSISAATKEISFFFEEGDLFGIYS